MDQSNKRVIIWCPSIIELMEDKPIGGIAVQMYFWAQIFAEQKWDVYSFAAHHKKSFIREGITFLPKRNIKHLNIMSEWWHAFLFISKIKPDIIIYRGANRELFPLATMCKVHSIKLLFFSASDVNFEPGKELVGNELNRKLYQRAIKNCDFFVVQNKHQQETLYQNYGKNCLLHYNIWGKVKTLTNEALPTSDAVWIANFRRLKRVEWILNAAEKLPNYKFVIAGGSADDSQYYEDMRMLATSLNNVDFLGSKSFFLSTKLVACSKVLLCTSTFEGFPNTFLQAWSNGLPVISTVDPSGIISEYKLGEIVHTEEELEAALHRILDNKEYYQKLQHNVCNFFKENHSAISGYNKIIQYIS